jgi:probable F420-dependent oxidoreductase
MEIGVVFPQTEIGHNPVAVRDYAQTAEGLGFSHIDAYDHVLGANPNRPGGWSGPYTHESSFLEIFVLLSYVAALTQKLILSTNIVILPQRQTVLAAKQAATIDVLSSGRLRFGMALGWNEVEYIALNENFKNRARRIEEQVEVLRLLWTQPLVQFDGRWHHIPDAGIKPLPIQRPIPIWFGGTADAALERAAKLGDGWMINIRAPQDARHAFDVVHRALDKFGRDRKKFGIEARLAYGDGDPRTWEKRMREWQDLGATLFSLNTMGAGLTSPQGHMDALRRFAQAIPPGA